MSLVHIPVLLNEVLDSFKDLKEGSRFADLTFGRGGHFKELIKQNSSLAYLAVDQDEQAISCAVELKKELGQPEELLNESFFTSFKNLPDEWKACDGILMDLGVSSPQLDDPKRGFSFYEDGPLDMRMDQRQELTAESLLAEASKEELVHIFHTQGEIRKPYRVVDRIIERREKGKAVQSTLELSELIERTDGWRKKGHHPATKYFMALRLVVNQEINELREALNNWIDVLSPGGILTVISFHSLEDRIVKHTFRDSTLGKPKFKKVIIPSDEEIKMNPRSRSAKLRIFIKNTETAEKSADEVLAEETKKWN